MNKLLTVLVIFASIHSLPAQQDPLVSVNTNNLLYYMPGSIGRLPHIVTNILYRRQWGQFQETPSLQLINVQMPFNYDRMGIAIQTKQEAYKDFNNKSIHVIYAYKIRFAKGRLVGGLQGGLIQQGFSVSGLLIKDDDDDLLQDIHYSTVPDVGVGIYYYDSKVEIGTSLKHMNKLEINDRAKYSSLRPHYYIFGARKFIIRNDYHIRPMILFRYVSIGYAASDLLFETGFKEFIKISIGIRTQKHLVLQTVINLNKIINSSRLQYDVSYSYDRAHYSKTNLSSNEIMLTIKYRNRPDPNKIRRRNRVSSPLLF